LYFANASPESPEILRHIPGHGEPFVDNRDGGKAIPVEAYLDDNIDEADIKSLKIPDRVLAKWGRLFDIVLPSSRRTCCFTRGDAHIFVRYDAMFMLKYIRLREDGGTDRIDITNERRAGCK
jgi:tRNA (cytosine38-C5)-methyltransferase